jgi:Fe-S cluster biosynthesis and repair protein YggX
VNLINEDKVNLINKDKVNLINEDKVNLINEDKVNLINKDKVNLINEDKVNLINKDKVNFINKDKVNLFNKDEIINKRPQNSNWVTEKYRNNFYRYTPKSLEDFYNSPICELITRLEQMILKYLNKEVHKVSWVIQYIACSNAIGVHDDVAHDRIISFVYYLTPDNYKRKHGGALKVYDGSEMYTINPIFNSLVMWDMQNNKSPLHEVTEVKQPGRIALVGFFQSEPIFA